MYPTCWRLFRALEGPAVGKLYWTEVLELRAVYATAYWSAYFVNQSQLKAAIAIRSRAQLRYVDVVAEAQAEVVVVKTSRQDGCVVEYTRFNFIGNARPQTKLE